MPHRVSSRMIVLVALAVLSVGLSAAAGPLEDYVNQKDINYAYKLVKQQPVPEGMAHILYMTAQAWRMGDVDKPLWNHWVTIICPNKVERDTALLIISGGNNERKEPPDLKGREVAAISQIVGKTGSVAVILHGIPSEPLVFNEEGKKRSEDEIIAYSFRKFVDTKDPTWPLLLPMVKSTVRCMDTTQDYLKKLQPAVEVKKFVVTGASKRGWTTWLTGAVDERVIGIAPMVIDVLNMKPHMQHQKEWYGTYSEEVKDYTDLNLTDFLASDEAQPLVAVVDPYSYRDKLTMPKLVLVGTSDQYWTVDAAKFYFPDLVGEKHIRYEANGDHGLDRAEDTIKALTAFFDTVSQGKKLPEFTWDISEDGSYKVTPKDKPIEARLWKAHSDKLDFRKITIGAAWNSSPILPNADGAYTGKVKAPKDGHDAFFIELVYPSSLGFNYTLSTLTCVPEPGFSPMIIVVLVVPVLALAALGWYIFR